MRRSALIALIALLLSLLLHLMGLPAVFRGPLSASDSAPAEEPPLAVEFEDFVAEVAEPEPPQEAQQPEPPEPAEEVTTSEALVASENPQDTLQPDTGEAEPQPPAPPDAPPAEAAPPPPAPQQPVETPPATPPQDSAQAPETPQAAEPLAPLPDVADAPETDLAALAPLPETPIPGDLDTAEPEPEETPSDLAVTTSPRPRAPDRRPAETPPETTTEDTTQEPSEDPLALLRPPETPIESPLEAYRRDPSAVSNWQGAASGSGGAGNSTTTNYAGKVLVQLNNTAPSRVNGVGSASVFFQIAPNGALDWVNVVSSRGSPDIIRAAKDQVRRSAPFPPTPTGRPVQLSFTYRSN